VYNEIKKHHTYVNVAVEIKEAYSFATLSVHLPIIALIQSFVTVAISKE